MIARNRLLAFCVLALACSSLAFPATGQTVAPQQATSALQPQRQIPIAHYYWHFLFHQNELDKWAAAQAAKGHDGSAVRNHLQVSLGLSDAAYVPIRTSSVRLTGRVLALNAQALAIKAAGPTATSSAQLQALAAQRDADINAEISYLKSSLSPAQITRLEAFMVQFFAPVKAASQQAATAQQSVPTAVQP